MYNITFKNNLKYKYFHKGFTFTYKNKSKTYIKNEDRALHQLMEESQYLSNPLLTNNSWL